MNNRVETRDGVCFERLPDGSVHLRKPEDGANSWVITAGDWAAVVAGVSARGNSSPMRAAAIVFHQEQPGPELPSLSGDDFPSGTRWEEETVPSRKV